MYACIEGSRPYQVEKQRHEDDPEHLFAVRRVDGGCRGDSHIDTDTLVRSNDFNGKQTDVPRQSLSQVGRE